MRKAIIILMISFAAILCACHDEPAGKTTVVMTTVAGQSTTIPEKTLPDKTTAAPIKTSTAPKTEVQTSVPAETTVVEKTSVAEEKTAAPATTTAAEQTTAAVRTTVAEKTTVIPDPTTKVEEKTTKVEETATKVEAETTAAPQTEPVVEPITEVQTEPVSEPVTEPQTEPVSEPATEPQTEPVSEPATEPQTEPVSEPATEPQTEPVSEPVTEPQTEPVTEPVTEPQTEPVTEPVEEPQIPAPNNDAVYIFVADSFVGAYAGGEWLSVSDIKVNYPQGDHLFYLQDILSVPQYSVYDYKSILQTDHYLIFTISEGLGGFSTADIALMAPYGEDTGFNMDGSTRIFSLPQQLDELAAKVAVPDYNFSAFLLTASEYAPVLTNAEHNILPWMISNDVPAQSDIDFMRSYLDSYGLTDAEVCIDNIYSGDFDNDGAVERLLIANSNDEYAIWQECEASEAPLNTGAYAFALLLHENGAVEEIFKEYHAFDLATGFDWTLYYFQIYGDGIYDFNADGIGELALEYAGWEWGNARIYSRNAEGFYELKLRGDWGM